MHVNVAAGALLIAALMLYFRLLGRLAWCCQEAEAEEEEKR